MATAKKQMNGTYRIQIYAGRDASGKRVYESFTSTKTGMAGKREVENMAANWALDRKEREANAGILTLGEAMNAYIETCRAQGCSPSTLREYTTISRNVCPALAVRKLSSITPADIQHALDARAAKHAPKTVRNDKGFLAAVLGVYARHIDLSGVKLNKKRPSRRKRVFRASDMQAILEASRDCPEFHLYILFTMQLGLRPSETYALTWADVSAEPMTMIDHGERLEYGQVSVSKARVMGEYGYAEKGPKTEAGNRVLSASWSFFELLYSLKQRGKPSEHIFKLRPNTISKRWSDLREQIGLDESFRFYDLRHYHATIAINAGASEEELAAEMGHSSSSITHAIYAEIVGESQTCLNANLIRQSAALLSTK